MKSCIFIRMHYYSNNILKQVRKNKIDILNLSMYGMATFEPGYFLRLSLKITNYQVSANFFVQVSSYVRSMSLKQYAAAGIADNAKFFLGRFDVNWPNIFLEMFSQKLDKLYIWSHYTNTFSKSNANFLKEASRESL